MPKKKIKKAPYPYAVQTVVPKTDTREKDCSAAGFNFEARKRWSL
jgi:hypothetical protein